MKRITLQKRLLLYSTLLIVLLMCGVILLVEKRLSDSIRSELEKRGEALGRSLAAVSANALVTYNYVALEQMAERATQEMDIEYIIISDKENRVAVFTGHDEKQGQILTDSVSQAAIHADHQLVQRTVWEGRHVLDFTVPVFIPQSTQRWGTVRVGLSLKEVHELIQRTRLGLAALGIVALAIGFAGAVVYARRITQPLKDLVRGTVFVSKGDLDHKIDVKTGDEIEELARNFTHMVEEVRVHRKELEGQLHEISALRRYQENILQSMTSGLIAIDLTGKITTVNQSGLNIISIGEDQLLGTSVSVLPGPWDVLGRVFLETLEEGQGSRNREVRIEKDGKNLWIMITTALLIEEDNEKLGVLGVFQDITDLRDLQEKMKEADRMAALGRLSASLAHEIKNPLSAIKTFVQLVPKKFDSPVFREKLNATVPRELERINRLIDNLLQLTRKPRLKLTSVDLNEIVVQALELYHEEMEKNHVEFDATLKERMPRIQADAELLHRVFSNILLNAIQAMPQGGKVNISTQRTSLADKNGALQVAVQDTGFGMDEETVRRLFDPFFTTKEKGTGLGMANAKKIVEEHKGRIDVKSGPGKGTLVRVTFPVE
jgi:two-component system sensor histidine kinase AtoS